MMTARKILRGVHDALNLKRGTPESFGWLKIEKHMDRTETWELPDGRVVRLPAEHIVTRVDYLPLDPPEEP